MTPYRLLGLLGLTPLLLCAQAPYDFEALTGTYVPLDNAPALEFDMYDYEDGWDDPEFTAQLGFTTDIDGISFNSVTQIGTGTILFALTQPSAGYIPTLYDLADLGFLNPKNPSLIRWETTGAPGEQVFALEFHNCGFYEEVFSDSVAPSFVNCALRVYEATGVIEYHFGSSFIGPNITEPSFSSLFLQFDPDSYMGQFLFLNGDAANPTMTLTDDFYDFYYSTALSGFPPDGTVYRFTPNGNTLSVPETAQDELTLSVWPNPTADRVEIAFAGRHGWVLVDAAGRTVRRGIGHDGIALDLTGEATGTYTFRLDNGLTERVVKH